MISKGSRVIVRGSKSDTSYPLHVSSVSHDVVVTGQPIVSLW